MRAAWSFVPLVLGACQHSAGTVDLPTTPVGQSDTLLARDVAAGVAYRKFVDRSPLNVLYLVRVDLRRSELELRHVRALDLLAAVNADFFATSGENENNQVIGGEWWKGLQVSESTFDTFDTAHAQFGTDASGRPLMDRFVLDGKAWTRGTLTPRDTVRKLPEAPMLSAGKRGDTLLYVRRGAISSTWGSAIPSNGAVLVAYGTGSSASNVQAPAKWRRSRERSRATRTSWPRARRSASRATARRATCSRWMGD